MTGTGTLIETLVARAGPVRRLPPPLVRTARWLLFAAALVGALALLHGVRPDLAERLRQPVFCASLAASTATGALAALAAFMASLPDRSRLWLLLPLPTAAAWVLTIGYGCLTDWVGLGGTPEAPGEMLRCIATLLLSSIPLSAVMFWMLRHAAWLQPGGPVLLGSLAVAALTATALSLLHQFDASAMILAWNIGVAALVLVVDAAVGRGALRLWRRRTA